MNRSLTRRGVARDLRTSPYFETVSYTDGSFVEFVFSSELYRRAFNMRRAANRERINASLSGRFGWQIENNKLADIKLYSTIEKRGFLLRDGRSEINCLSKVKLDGQKMTCASSGE